jgi:hypothetical protein
MSNARYSIIAARAVFDVDKDNGITPTELRVLCALGTYTNDEGWCFPNQTTLAERLQITRQTISGAIKKLVAKGYVETEVRTAKGRGKVGYNYRVMLDLKRAEAEPKAEATGADIGAGRQRPQPTTAPADFGADHDPMSAQASVPYTEVTTPTERPQQSSPVSNETEEDTRRKAYEAAEQAKADAKAKRKPKAKAARKPVAYTAAFEMIWLAWPKHRRANSDKRKAFERYQSGVEQFGADAVSAAATRYLSLPDTRKDQWRYCCLVEVFMNGKLEAAVEAARDTDQETVEVTHEDAVHGAARAYFAKKGKWPQGYIPPAEARA